MHIYLICFTIGWLPDDIAIISSVSLRLFVHFLFLLHFCLFVFLIISILYVLLCVVNHVLIVMTTYNHSVVFKTQRFNWLQIYYRTSIYVVFIYTFIVIQTVSDFLMSLISENHNETGCKSELFLLPFY